MSERIATSGDQLEGTEHPRGWLSLGAHNYIKILVIGGLLFYLFQNEIWLIVRRWFTDPSWSHGILIPLFSFYFLNQHKKKLIELRLKRNYLGLILLLLVLLFYILNTVQFRRGYLSRITVLASMASIVLFVGGWALVRYCWFPIGFLIFAIPLPTRIYRALTIPMRQWAATVASALLNLVSGLEATAHGVVIDVFYNGKHMVPPLDVAEACSGMRLLMAFLALGVAMAYLHYRPFWQRLILLILTIPIAIFCNIVRVTVTGFIYILIGPKYAQGMYHDFLGLSMLPLAFVLYGFTTWFLSSLFIEEGQVEIKEDVVVRRK